MNPAYRQAGADYIDFTDYADCTVFIIFEKTILS